MSIFDEAFGGEGFDAKEVEPAGGDLGVMPAGKYKMAIIETQEKESKNDSENRYLEVTFEVVEGQYKGRRLGVARSPAGVD